MANYEDEYVQGYIGNSSVADYFRGRTQKIDIDGNNSMKGDIESQHFKYFLKEYKDTTEEAYLNFQFEDPTLLGFEIVLDTVDSPLFSDGGVDKTAAINFIRQYNNIPEIAVREKLLSEFKRILFLIFDKDFNSQNIRNKTYYIESILGLEKLNTLLTNYNGVGGDGDKLTITLTEDVSMISSYLAELYNNLSYSYKNQREIIPENCLRFDMKIRIRDKRNFGFPNTNYDPNDPDSTVININDSYISNIIYTLHDCNFFFRNSLNFQQQLDMGGFTQFNNTPAALNFDIYYKSISKEFRPDLIPNGKIIVNKKVDILNETGVDGDSKVFDFKFGKSQITEKTQSALLQKLKTTVKGELDMAKDKLISKYKEWRGDVVNELFDQIGERIDINPEWLGNVYDADFEKLTLQGFVNNLGARGLNDVESSINTGLDIIEGGILGGIGL